MLLEEQTAGRKPDPQSLGLIWCFCNVIPHTRESTQSTTALWHSWLLCSCLTLSAPCNLQKHWTLLSALSLQSTSQAPLTWEPCPSWYHALTEVLGLINLCVSLESQCSIRYRITRQQFRRNGCKTAEITCPKSHFPETVPLFHFTGTQKVSQWVSPAVAVGDRTEQKRTKHLSMAALCSALLSYL